jgi:hypothetical protein
MRLDRLLAPALGLAAAALLAGGCGTEPATGTSSGTGTGAGSGTGSSSGTGSGTVAGELTLDSCTTTIPASAPAGSSAEVASQLAFFRKYFRCVDVTVTGDGRFTITSRGLPPHRSWYYPATSPNYTAFPDTGSGCAEACPARTTCRADGACRFKNPGQIAATSIAITVPSSPTRRAGVPEAIPSTMVDRAMNTSSYEYAPGPVGVALDSVALFNDQAAPGDSIDAEVYSFDAYAAHPAGATYHYHAATPGPLEVLRAIGATASTTPGQASVELYGIMCDGVVVLGCTELDGTRVTSATGLDAQNGHVGDLRDADGTAYFTGRYHTHVCPGVLTAHKYAPEIQYYSGAGGRTCPQ